jgi:A/G-specific adenine glycosylase
MNVTPAEGGPERLRRALLAHYDRERRVLPWRGETDPYRVLVSEVMLQQTRVETVKGYYEPWLRRFPDLESLAAAETDQVLKAWEGLGYYRRARNLHRAARVQRARAEREYGDASRRSGISLPSSAAALRTLPGVGEYTAGAVASIAFGEAVPAVDGNVRRVLARLHDVAAPKGAWLRKKAAALVDPERPGDWNQALMELGATVCTPAAPDCGRCPLGPWCSARARGTQGKRPARPRKRAVPRKLVALAVLGCGQHVMVVRRPRGGLLGGMWAFPEWEIGEPGEGAAVAPRIAEAAGLASVREPIALPAVEHRFTHLYVTYLPWALEVSGGAAAAAEARWIVLGEPTDLAIPVAQRRVLDARASLSLAEGW